MTIREIEYIEGPNPYLRSIEYYEGDKVIGFLNYSLIYDRIEVDNLLVNEENRNMGIGKYLWENIADIFEYFMNKDIHAIIVYPKPHTIIKNGNTFEKEPIEDDEMLQKMKSGLVLGGYKEIDNSNYFMKIYLDESTEVICFE